MAFRLLREVENAKTEAAFLMTECKTEPYEFHALGSREVVGHFEGGDITTDATTRERTGITHSLKSLILIVRDRNGREMPLIFPIHLHRS